MTDVTIIGLPQSNFVWAARIALAEKGVAHDVILAPPNSPEALAVHPLGKIPVLLHGEVAIAESRAIIDYIDETFDGARLVPQDLAGRIASGMWTAIVATSVEPLLIRQFLFAHMFPGTPDNLPDAARIDALVPEVAKRLDMLEAALAAGHIGGEAFGRVDAYLVPILFYCRNTAAGAELVGTRPRLSAYLERQLARDSVAATMPGPAA
jgi:glutathione S-transferase